MKRNPDEHIYTIIYDIVKAIPKGRVTSYGAIAAAIGLKSGARLVGYAMNHSHVSTESIPAHRVVNAKGLLTGRHHFHPPEKMEQLLQAEGVTVINNAVKNFDVAFWDPAIELV